MKKEVFGYLSAFWQFVLNKMNSELLVFLFCLVLSTVFWLMMTLNEVYEREVPFRMELTGVPSNVVITTELDDTVIVVLRDKGYNLMGYSLMRDPEIITFNFSTYANRKSGVGTIPQTELAKNIQSRLDASTTIVSIKNDKRSFYFNNGDSKKVPVRLTGRITPRRNYYLSRSVVHPDSVTVYASLSMLDSIKHVESVPFNVTDLSDTLHLVVDLEKKPGIKCKPEKISVDFFADVLTEQEAEVGITTLNITEGKVLRPFPSKVKVRYVVGASMSRTINLNDFEAVIDFQEVSTSSQNKCKVRLTKKPASVKNATLITDEVDYLIEEH